MNAESVGGKKARITGWEGIEKGPDVLETTDVETDEPSILESDVEYFKNNPKELSDLVADLVELRGGADAIKEGATWDKNMRAYVGADGLPRDWGHLTGYLKRNPDAIGKVLEEYNELQADSSQDAVAGGAGAAPEAAAVAETIDAGDSTQGEAIAAAERATAGVAAEASGNAEPGVLDNSPAVELSGKTLSNTDALSAINKIGNRIDSIADSHEQSMVWEAIKNTLDNCSDDVKAQVEYMRAEQTLRRDQDFLAQKKAELRKMPLFTFPWSKRHREKNNLKDIITSTTKSLKYQSGKVDELSKALPESVSDEDRELVSKFRELDARMDRSNADLRVRGFAKVIKMREKWIRNQEASIKRFESSTKAINDPGEAARREAIQRWQGEIAELQAHIDEYSAQHPDFVMDPTKKSNNESLDKAA